MEGEQSGEDRESGWKRISLGAAVGTVATVAILLLVFFAQSPRGTPIEIHPPPPTLTPEPTPTCMPLTVYVTGHVNRPGVVEVAPGARLTDAIQAAGGPSLDAQMDAINLAAPLVDGQHVRVPAVGEETPPIASPSDPDDTYLQPISINTATADELVLLPGVGEVTANNIIAYREEHGPFSTIEDIMNVPGIGEGKYEGFREMITVGP